MAPKAQAADAQVVENPRAKARATYVRVTPMKARRVIDLIRGLPADEALTVLRFAPQAASEPIYKVVASAVANAEHNLRLDPETLIVATAYVDEGPTLKRFRPRAQGRAFRINKRTSHITIELESIAPAPAKKAPGRSAPAAKAAPARKAPAKKATARAADEATAAPAAKAAPAEKAAKAPRARKAAKAAADAPEPEERPTTMTDEIEVLGTDAPEQTAQATETTEEGTR